MTDDPTERNRPRSDPDRTREDGTVATTQEIERALGQLSPPGASLSVFAVRTVDGAIVAAATPDRALPPASNTKLITAALSLDRLGPDHCFETTLAARGPIADRRLEGDLVLRGSGAPDLTPADLEGLADTASTRIDRVTGNLICDVARFTGPQRGPGRVWSDERHPYGARSSALAVSGNVVAVTLAATDEGTVVSVEPESDAVALAADVALEPSGSDGDGDPDLDVVIDRDGGKITVQGTISPGETETLRAPVRAPVRHGGLLARDALAAAGIEVAGELRIVDDHHVETNAVLATVESAPLRTLVRTMNVDSDNFVADQLARGTAASAGDGSWEAWSELVDERFSALGIEPVRIRDGSGLSRYNRLPARGMVALLEWATNRPWVDAFFESLPGPGEGTLSDRLQGVPVIAKTGTLTGTRALSGRVGTGADAVFFSILVSGITVDAEAVRDGQDELVRALAATASEGG